MTTYSFRHKIRSVLRAAGVLREIAEFQLGHAKPSGSMSDSYGVFELDYLQPAKEVIEDWRNSLGIVPTPESRLAQAQRSNINK